MREDFNSLLEGLKKCEICKEKFGFQPHPIFLGNVNSKIVQISQAPSATVHETLKPFTDQSGKKLKYEWYKIDDETFYNPDNFYIAALAHCYPGKDKNGNDRMPPKICYEKWIKKELEYINNKLYIGIDTGSDSFEAPDVYDKVTDKEVYKKIKKEISLITMFVDTLELDNGIFRKVV